MSEQIDIDININMENVDEFDELTSKIQEATAEVERLQAALEEAVLNGDQVEAERIAEELGDARDRAGELQEQLNEIKPGGLDDVNETTQATESSMSSLTTAAAGLAGVIGVDQMVETADRINTSWNQLKLTFGDTGVSLDELKLKTGQAADATGMSGSEVRGYFNSMGIAGIKNSDLLSSSFQSLAGRSYQTGSSIEAMQKAVQKMVMSGTAGKLSLQRLGITTEDLAKAMGVTKDEVKETFENLDQEGRLEAITKAMGDGKEANDMYKDSYAGLKHQAETAAAGLMGAIGQGVLPTITPMIQGATSLINSFTSGFKNLPGPVQGAIGSIGGFVAIGTATIGTLGLLGQVGSGVVGGLRSMKSGYDTVRGAMGTARAMMDALRNSESITEGVRAALAIATGAEATAEGGSTAAKTAAIGPTTGLAIAENSLLWPLLLIVGAIIAVVAVMWYLYNTNETVRNGINWLIAQIQAFIASLQPIVTAIISFVSQGIANMGRLPGAIWNIFLRVISFVASWASQFVAKGVQAVTNFVNNVRSVMSGIAGAISSALSGVYNAIVAPFQRAYDFIYNSIIKPLEDAWNAVSSAVGASGYSSFEGYSGYNDTLNNTISNISSNNSNDKYNVNNNFYGLIEESAADYIVNAVNDRLRREKMLKGA